MYRTFHLLFWLFSKPVIMGQLSVPDLSYSVMNTLAYLDSKKIRFLLKTNVSD